MKSMIVALIAVFAAAVGRGGPAESAVLAAMRLSEQPNYSWVSTVVDDVRSYEIEGKTQRNGCTWVRLPMALSLARRLGRWAGSDVEAIFRGNEACVILTGRGWEGYRELPRRNSNWDESDELRFRLQWQGTARLASFANSPVVDPVGPLAQMLQATPIDNDAPPYSNVQFGVSHPHEELGVIVSSNTGITVDGDIASGTLSDLGAQLLLVRDGQEDIKPIAAAGTFRLQIANGLVTKYVLRLEGLLEVEGRRVHVHQISSTAVIKVGTTKVDAPEEARRKLGLD
jgi:hypothetical protein